MHSIRSRLPIRSAGPPADADSMTMLDSQSASDGVRLLSHRPSVLYKVEHLATEPVDGDIAVEGLVLAGPAWADRLKDLLGALSQSERACLFTMRLGDDQALPLLADTLLDRSRTDWFPDFLSHGQMKPHFQPIVELATGRVFGREALMRGKLGAVEVRGGELLAAAEAHDALFSFDYRARTAALEVVKPERCPDREMLAELVIAHRKRGARVALDDMSGGAESLLYLETLRPDVVKIDNALTAGIQHSPARRRLIAALVDCAHEQGCKVVAEGVERVDEFQAMADLGVDLGQGYYFGQPTDKPMAVDPRLVRHRAELV